MPRQLACLSRGSSSFKIFNQQCPDNFKNQQSKFLHDYYSVCWHCVVFLQFCPHKPIYESSVADLICARYFIWPGHVRPEIEFDQKFYTYCTVMQVKISEIEI